MGVPKTRPSRFKTILWVVQRGHVSTHAGEHGVQHPTVFVMHKPCWNHYHFKKDETWNGG